MIKKWPEGIKTVLLDMDGTLLDSNHAHAKAWQEALIEFGFIVPYLQVREKIGMGGDHLLGDLIKLRSKSKLAKRIEKRRSQIFKKKYLPHLKLFPFVKSFLKELVKNDYQIGIASSAKKSELNKILNHYRLIEFIGFVTSSKPGIKSKPSPDIIRLALKQTNTSSEQALMIGDTPYDIQAARKAKVKIFALESGGWHRKKLATADLVAPNLKSLLGMLKRS